MSRSFLLILGLLTLSLSCNVFENDLDSMNLEIQFLASSMITNRNMIIDNEGGVIIKSADPELVAQLNVSDLREVRKTFHRATYMNYNTEYYCVDNIHFTFIISEDKKNKQFSVDTCAFSRSDQQANLLRLKKMYELMMDIYDELNPEPWIQQAPG